MLEIAVTLCHGQSVNEGTRCGIGHTCRSMSYPVKSQDGTNHAYPIYVCTYHAKDVDRPSWPWIDNRQPLQSVSVYLMTRNVPKPIGNTPYVRSWSRSISRERECRPKRFGMIRFGLPVSGAGWFQAQYGTCSTIPGTVTFHNPVCFMLCSCFDVATENESLLHRSTDAIVARSATHRSTFHCMNTPMISKVNKLRSAALVMETGDWHVKNSTMSLETFTTQQVNNFQTP